MAQRHTVVPTFAIVISVSCLATLLSSFKSLISSVGTLVNNTDLDRPDISAGRSVASSEFSDPSSPPPPSLLTFAISRATVDLLPFDGSST